MSAALIDLETTDFAIAARQLITSGVDEIGIGSRRSWSVLAGCGGMAGSDPGGVAWAAAYDRAAATALNSAIDAGAAVGQLARMFGQTARNYELADAHSSPAVRRRLADTVAAVPVVPRLSLPGCTPPSAAGSGASGGPPGWGLICHAVGYLWPNGSQGRLHDAAGAWRSGATALRTAADAVLDAPRAARAHLLPEAPDMTSVCQDTSDHLREIADVHDQLADACLQLAEDIDHVHAEVVDELESLLEWSAGIEAGGAVLSLFTFGAAEVPTQAMEASRIARTAEVVGACIQRFVSAVHALGAAVGEIAERASLLGARLRRLVELPLLEPALAGVGPLRALSEARDLGKLGALGRLEMSAEARTLEQAEAMGGHTILKHVGLTDAELIARGKKQASTFKDLETAETLTRVNLRLNRAKIRAWLKGDEFDLPVVSRAPANAGRIYVKATGEFIKPRRVRTVLFRRGNGYYVHTSYLEG